MRSNGAAVPALIAVTILGLLFGGLVLRAFIPMIFSGFFDLFTLLPLSMTLFGVALIVCVVIADVTVATRLVRAKNMRFEVVEDELSRIEEEYIVRYGRDTLERVFYFQSYGRYVIGGDGSVFDYSSVGDRFYLVIFPDSRDQTPQRIYNKKVYKWTGK